MPTQHWALFVVVCLYIAYVGGIAARSHYGLGSYGYDVGIFDQGVWLLSQFETPFVTVMGRNLFGDHTSFILIFLVPFYWLFDTAAVLIWSQTILLAAGAIPLYFVALRVLGTRRWAWLIAAAYLAHPVVAQSNLDQFHPEAFYPVLLGFAFLSALRNKPWHVLIFCVLILMVKEDAFLICIPFAIYLAWNRQRRLAVGISLLSLSVFAVNMLVVVPTLLPGGTIYTGRLPFGGVRGTIETAIKRPGELFDYLRSDNRPWYVWQLLAPALWLPLAAKRVAFIGSGVLALNLISQFGYMHRIQFHYSIVLASVVGLATIYGVNQMRSRINGRWLAVGLVILASWSAVLWGPFAFSSNPYSSWTADRPEVIEANAVKSLIPDGVSVSAEYSLVPLLTHRDEIFQFPSPFRGSLYGRFDQEQQPLPQAETVEYVFLFNDLSDEDMLVWNEFRSQFAPIVNGEFVSLYRRR